jgi:hypothetical protein
MESLPVPPTKEQLLAAQKQFQSLSDVERAITYMVNAINMAGLAESDDIRLDVDFRSSPTKVESVEDRRAVLAHFADRPGYKVRFYIKEGDFVTVTGDILRANWPHGAILFGDYGTATITLNITD